MGFLARPGNDERERLTMPFSRFVMVVASAAALAGLTVWLGSLVTSLLKFNGSLSYVAISAVLAATAALRLLSGGFAIRNTNRGGGSGK